MVQTQQVTPGKFLEMYSRKAVEVPVLVKVGTENRLYGRTTEGQATNPDGYIVVYCVV